MHVSLDGFVGGPNGEMDWITVDEELFDFASARTHHSDAALYGRKTWEMMEGYWPTADQVPNPSKHTREHAPWYRSVNKYVISNTIKSDPSKKVIAIGGDLDKQVSEIKKGNGKEILIFGSPSAGQALAKLGLVDEYWLFINPVLLGKGIPMFNGQKEITKMKLVTTHIFKNGVVCLNHQKI